MSAGFEELLREARNAFRTQHGLSQAPSPDSPAADAAESPASTVAAASANAGRADEPDPLLAAARRHRVIGLLRAGGSPHCAGAAWTSAARGQALHSTRCAAEAARVAAALASAGIVATLIKGPALAAQAWPDPGLRAFDDLDFRVPRAQGATAEETLCRAGYLPEIPDARRRSHYWHFGWGVSFRHPDGFRVEINHRCFPPHYPCPRTLTDGEADGVTTLDLDGAPVRTLTPDRHLLLCCIHALWHGGERLGWIADIAGLLALHPGAFERALAAVRGFPRRALLAGVGIAETLFGPELAPAAGRETETAQQMFIAQLRRNAAVSESGRRALHRALMTPAERAGYFVRRALTPGDGDFRRRVLPPALRALYWVYRPLRALGF